MRVPIQLGVFVRPAGAILRNVVDPADVASVWEEVGPCLAYPKPDGWRIQAHLLGETLFLFSRKGKDYTLTLSDVARALRQQIADWPAILDLEVIALDANGHHLAP